MISGNSWKWTPARFAVICLAALAVAACDAEDDDTGTDSVGVYRDNMDDLESKFVDLATAMGSDTYGWRPMEGVRSVSEVFMLMVAENYVFPSMWDAEPPEGMTVEMSMFRSLPADVTAKEEVLEDLRESFVYFKQTVDDLDTETLNSTIDYFGTERSVRDALFLMITDMHEHLGQAIAYTRANHVVPPWTARRMANQ